MKCEEVRPLLIDLLYDEISDENKRRVRSHLETCQECREEFASLKSTSNILQKWEDVDPEFKLVLVNESVTWIERAKQFFGKILPGPAIAARRFGYGLAAAFLLLAIANTEISYQQGNFHMRLSLFSGTKQSEPAALTTAQTEALIKKMRQENYYLTQSLISQSEARLRNDWATSLTQLNKTYEQQRLKDLQLVGSGLVNLQRNTYQKIKRTDSSINELLRYISAPQK
ncbi:MAG: hypothetical protein GXO74_05305 [Calditrichaeota bacterium]|nr:hypothetical protein [Calditrichota bacterium]